MRNIQDLRKITLKLLLLRVALLPYGNAKGEQAGEPQGRTGFSVPLW
ncbi:MAG: hypothetical protein RMZ43_010940 [Nostoc sp. CmiVER01]|nr:hypothetical protein [Nostoc sp. CmiVER01]MDZ8127028.1 hypothetical protein [Nostoc sp. CmiVER01]